MMVQAFGRQVETWLFWYLRCGQQYGKGGR